jgi:hypothetical protein
MIGTPTGPDIRHPAFKARRRQPPEGQELPPLDGEEFYFILGEHGWGQFSVFGRSFQP